MMRNWDSVVVMVAKLLCVCVVVSIRDYVFKGFKGRFFHLLYLWICEGACFMGCCILWLMKRQDVTN
jgi:hypothetical protein